MPQTYRCKYNQIWNSQSRRYRCCKNKIKFGKFCFIHLQIHSDIITFIQRMYRGYYIRRKLKNIYYNLPCDLQKKILYYVNKDVYYTNSVKKIIYNRYTRICDNSHYRYVLRLYTKQRLLDYMNEYPLTVSTLIEQLLSLYHLSIKYDFIVKPNYYYYARWCSFINITKNFNVLLMAICCPSRHNTPQYRLFKHYNECFGGIPSKKSISISNTAIGTRVSHWG